MPVTGFDAESEDPSITKMGGFSLLSDYYNRPIRDRKHSPLELGWSDEQLAPIVELLSEYMPDGTSDRMALAVASCARTLVVDTRLTGMPLRYYRRKENYGGPARYRGGDPFHTWHFMTGAIDRLVQAELAGHDLGEWSPAGGRQSVAWPTDELANLLEPVIDLGERRGDEHLMETVVLRDREDKREIDYDETAETIALRTEVQALNDALKKLRLYKPGEHPNEQYRPFPIPLMRRIFNGELTRGGRCYCKGRSFQNIPSDDRLDLQLLIDGVLHPVVEIDYANLHAVMAYTEAGLAIPPGDQYEIEGFDRTVIKRAFNVLLNATTRPKAVSALVEDIHVRDKELWKHSGLATRLRSECFPYAEAVIAAIEEKHHPIAAFFGSDSGAAFMRRDSDMAVRVMLRMVEKTGRCPLPVHDSFLVPDIDQEALEFIMREVALEEGLDLCLKVSTGLSV